MSAFVLYRILGNDLPPRHRSGQTLENVRFILEHEPPLEDCEKRWLLNRIVDERQEAALVALLERHRQAHSRLPFVDAGYLGWNIRFEGLPAALHLHRREFRARSEFSRLLIREWCFRERNLYLMNNNGARNAALREGRAGGAEWVLPFDGNCFFTAAGWRELRDAAAAAGSAPYLVVPMARVVDNAALLDPAHRPDAPDEPQIGFRRDAAEEFDERRRYGSMPKASLLYRLGVPGRWQEYGPRVAAWEAVDLSPSRDAGRFATGGWVARLFSGHGGAEESHDVRERLRLQSILTLCRQVDQRAARKRFRPDPRAAEEALALARAVMVSPHTPLPSEPKELLRWLRRDPAAAEAEAREDAVGAAHTVAVAAVAILLGELALAREHLQAAKMRKAPASDDERQLWAALARLGSAVGVDLPGKRDGVPE